MRPRIIPTLHRRLPQLHTFGLSQRLLGTATTGARLLCLGHRGVGVGGVVEVVGAVFAVGPAGSCGVFEVSQLA